MSWLAKQIKVVLRTKGDAHAAIEAMMNTVREEYDARRSRGELRVHDKDGEGVLYGERNYVMRNPQTGAMVLTCSREMISVGKEEGFSRGLFNQKQLQINDSDVRLISYEAPMLRKSSGRGGGICKLDLVALDDAAIWAIEYKQRPGQVTTTRYGILEALAYGFLMACHIRDCKEAMRKQVAKCMECRGPFAAPVLAVPDVVKFVVAAPFKFYCEDLRTPRRLRLTEAICHLARGYSNEISQQHRLRLHFGGVLVIGSEGVELVGNPVSKDKNEKEIVVPYFSRSPVTARAFDDIQGVWDHVKKKCK